MTILTEAKKTNVLCRYSSFFVYLRFYSTVQAKMKKQEKVITHKELVIIKQKERE